MTNQTVLRSWWHSILTVGLSESASQEERRLLRFHRICVILMIWVAPAFALLSLLMREWWFFTLMLGLSLCYGAVLWTTFRGQHTISKVLYNYGVTLTALLGHVAFGGVNTIHFWFLSTTLYAAAVYTTSEWRYKIGNIVLSVTLFIGCTVNNIVNEGFTSHWRLTELPPSILAASDLGVLVVTALIAVFLSTSIRISEQRLAEEHSRSERLLLNVLPQAIAERLKRSEQTIAERHAEATVLFADIVGFTPLSTKLAPQELVELLNSLFSQFDLLAQQHELEKIKTIGDAYMVAGGVPLPAADHARRVAAMALEMLAASTSLRSESGAQLDLRIGIHSGPVVAGVIGRSKFAYDLWGDTVNTASRMESTGLPGKIQISQATYQLLQNDFHCEARGEVQIKGKGPMETYFLLQPASPAREG